MSATFLLLVETWEGGEYILLGFDGLPFVSLKGLLRIRLYAQAHGNWQSRKALGLGDKRLIRIEVVFIPHYLLACHIHDPMDGNVTCKLE